MPKGGGVGSVRIVCSNVCSLFSHLLLFCCIEIHSDTDTDTARDDAAADTESILVFLIWQPFIINSWAA